MPERTPFPFYTTVELRPLRTYVSLANLCPQRESESIDVVAQILASVEIGLGRHRHRVSVTAVVVLHHPKQIADDVAAGANQQHESKDEYHGVFDHRLTTQTVPQIPSSSHTGADHDTHNRSCVTEFTTTCTPSRPACMVITTCSVPRVKLNACILPR